MKPIVALPSVLCVLFSSTLHADDLEANRSRNVAPSATVTASSDTVSTPVAALRLSVRPLFLRENDGPFAALATVTRSGSIQNALTVFLASSDSNKLRVPLRIVIPAGASSSTFWVGAVDDGVAGSTRRVRLTARAEGLRTGEIVVGVTDNGDVNAYFTLDLPNGGIFRERAGEQQIGALVTLRDARTGRPIVTPRDIPLTVISSDRFRVEPQRGVILFRGNSSFGFTLRIIDNNASEPLQRVTITVKVPGFGTASRTVAIIDDESPGANLQLELNSNVVQEGVRSVNATLSRRNVPLGKSLTVSLRSSNPGAAQVPTTLTIPAGSQSMNFQVLVRDNSIPDSTRHVSIFVARENVLLDSVGLQILNDDF